MQGVTERTSARSALPAQKRCERFDEGATIDLSVEFQHGTLLADVLIVLMTP